MFQHYYNPGDQARSNVLMFKPQSGDTNTLYYGGGFWTLRSASGERWHFNQFGGLIGYRDRFRNGYIVEVEPSPLYALYLRYCTLEESKTFYTQADRFDQRLCQMIGRITGELPASTFDAEGWDPNAGLTLQLPDEDFSCLTPSAREVAAGMTRTGVDYRRFLTQGRDEAERLFSRGPRPEPAYGGGRTRPLRVRDDLGRALVFEYHEKNDQNFGLLKSVIGPQGARVLYAYDAPGSGYPERLNERFLVTATRADTSGQGDDVVPSAQRSMRYTYNWPGTSSIPSYDDIAQDLDALRDEYIDYYSTFMGCDLVNGDIYARICESKDGWCVSTTSTTSGSSCIESIDSTANCSVVVSDMPGNPCLQADFEIDRIISAIADNLVRVERGDLNQGRVIESETKFVIDPHDVHFDKATEQLYGGMSLGEYDAPKQGAATSGGWLDDARPAHVFAYASSYPVLDATGMPTGADATEASSAIPSLLKGLYPLEKPLELDVPDDLATQGEECYVTDIDPYQPGNQSYAASCDASTGALQNREDARCSLNIGRLEERKDLPGHHILAKYDALAPPAGADDPTHPKLFRSRLTCTQLAAYYAANPAHNGLLEELVVDESSQNPAGSLYQHPAEWVTMPSLRDQMQDDLRRICAWTSSTDRDGDTTVFGLNFKGQIVVRALEKRSMPGTYTINETLFNADGNAIVVRDPFEASTASDIWSPQDGYTTLRYDEDLAPASVNDPIHSRAFWWTRRHNLLETTVYPAAGQPIAVEWNGDMESPAMNTGMVKGVVTKIAYEHLFNQPRKLELGYISKTDAYVAERRTTMLFDYQEFESSTSMTSDLKLALDSLVPFGY